MCRMCLRNCPSQAISEQVDAPQPQIDKSQWHDILVYVEHSDGRIHPVTLELIGKHTSWPGLSAAGQLSDDR